jgi:DNA-directed RNA polymerase subunit RPC12/RpoP
MPIRFRCVYCNQLLGIARRKAGTVVNCPHCGERLIVPTPEADDESAEIKSQPQPQPQPRGELASPTANKPPQAKMPQRASDAAEVVSAPKPAPKPAPPKPAPPPNSLNVAPNRHPAPAPVPAPTPAANAAAAASPPAPAPSPSPAVRLFEQSDIAKLLLADANPQEAQPPVDQQPGPGKVGRRPGSNTAAPEPLDTPPATTESTITINHKLATVVSVAVVLSLAFSFLMGVLVGRFLLR